MFRARATPSPPREQAPPRLPVPPPRRGGGVVHLHPDASFHNTIGICRSTCCCFKGLQRWMDKIQTQVAAVVIMACNRADYLERTIKSILNYQNAVASKFTLYVSQDGSDPQIRKKASSYDQLTYMQGMPNGALDELFYKHNLSRVNHT